MGHLIPLTCKESRARVRPALMAVRQFSCSDRLQAAHCMRRGLNSVLEVKRQGTCIGSVSWEAVMVDHHGRAVLGDWQHLRVGNGWRSHHFLPENALVTQGASKGSVTLLPWQQHLLHSSLWGTNHTETTGMTSLHRYTFNDPVSKRVAFGSPVG